MLALRIVLEYGRVVVYGLWRIRQNAGYLGTHKSLQFLFLLLFSFLFRSFIVLLYRNRKKISKMNRRKMKIGSMMALKASFLVMVFSMGVIAPAIAQNKQNRKPRKKLKELLMMADSLRLQLRQSADR